MALRQSQTMMIQIQADQLKVAFLLGCPDLFLKNLGFLGLLKKPKNLNTYVF